MQESGQGRQVDMESLLRCLSEIETCARDSRQFACHAQHFKEQASRPHVVMPGQKGDPNANAQQVAAESTRALQVAMGRMFHYADVLHRLMTPGEEAPKLRIADSAVGD